MDWTTPLRAQQADFIQRLKSAHLLHCDTHGQNSELTVISGERLKQLRDFCWEMAEKYKRNSQVRDVFINNLKGKLAEEVVKARLGNLVTEVDYEKRIGGDGKVDFRLSGAPHIAIQVKARHGSIDTIQWSINKEEAEKNAALICVLIHEEVNEAQAEYNLIMAGFLPTNMISVNHGLGVIGIDQLLYTAGLRCYLESLKLVDYNQNTVNLSEVQQKCDSILYLDETQLCEQEALPLVSWSSNIHQPSNQIAEPTLKNQINSFPSIIHKSLHLLDNGSILERGSEYFWGENYSQAIECYTVVIQSSPSYKQAGEALFRRGLARAKLGEYHKAIEDYTQILEYPYPSRRLWNKPNYVEVYFNRGVAYDDILSHQKAIEDYTQTVKLNPTDYRAYKKRGDICYKLGILLKASEDYTQAININPSYAQAYYKRGDVYTKLKDKRAALKDIHKAAELFQQQGNQENYQKVLDRIGKFDIVAD